MPPPAIREFAPAKVNLALHVMGQRADGYHLLDSLVVFAKAGDWVSAQTAPTLSLRVIGPKAMGVPCDATNLVLKAAYLLQNLRNVSVGAAITLEKHLPHGGGIGGGSSDAAATIRLLARLWDVRPLTAAEALPLGADVPVCLQAPAPTLMRGIGENVSPAPHLPAGWLTLVNPGIHIPTPAVFRAYDDLYGDGTPVALEPLPDTAAPLSSDDFQMWLLAQSNYLTKVVAEDRFAPVITETILPKLRALKGCLDTDMSGSGSTCWAWFEAAADAQAAAASMAQDHPAWWVVCASVLHQDDNLS